MFPWTIALLGAGAMGSLVEGSLATQPVSVISLDVNMEHVHAIRTSGLHVILGAQMIDLSFPSLRGRLAEAIQAMRHELSRGPGLLRRKELALAKARGGLQ